MRKEATTVASKDTHYGYEAGWMDARDVVFQAMSEAKYGSPAYVALHALWDSMGTEVRNEKRDAYAREVESY